MASIHRKPNSPYWMMKYRAEDGRVVMRSTKQRDHRKALVIANETERMAEKARAGEITQAAVLKNLGEILERTTGESIPVKNIKSFFDEYLDSKKSRGTASSTIKRYNPVLNGFLQSIPPARQKASIGSITVTEIENFINREKSSGKSESTCDFTLKVLSSVLASAHRKGFALSNPALAVEPFYGTPNEREPFSRDHVKALLKAADNEWKGMILLGYHAGLRLQDASNLKWENIDQSEWTLKFEEMKTARRKRKEDSSTRIVLHHDLIDWLKKQKAGIGKAPLFPRLHGRAPGSAQGLSNEFGSLMRKADIKPSPGKAARGKGRTFQKFSFHSLRHSMVSNLANAGVEADIRKQISGHSSDSIHRRYVHMDLSRQKTAVDKISSVRE